MYDRQGRLLTFWIAATLGFGALGVAILFAPPNVVAALRVDLFYSPGYVLYRTATGLDFEGGTEWWHYLAIVGGTAVVWGSLATVLAWFREKVESALAFAATVAFVVVALVFAWSTYGMIPRVLG